MFAISRVISGVENCGLASKSTSGTCLGAPGSLCPSKLYATRDNTNAAKTVKLI